MTKTDIMNMIMDKLSMLRTQAHRGLKLDDLDAYNGIVFLEILRKHPEWHDIEQHIYRSKTFIEKTGLDLAEPPAKNFPLNPVLDRPIFCRDYNKDEGEGEHIQKMVDKK